MLENQNITFILTRRKSFLGKMISLFTKCKYTHASLLVYDDPLFVVELQKNSLNNAVLLITNYEDYIKLYENILLLETNVNVNVKQYKEFCFELTNTEKYNFFNLLFYQPVYRLTGIWIGDKHNDKKNVCSSLCAYVLNYYNKDLCRDYAKYSPSDLMKLDCIINKIEVK